MFTGIIAMAALGLAAGSDASDADSSARGIFLLVPFHATNESANTYHRKAEEEISHAFIFLSEDDLAFIEHYFKLFAPHDAVSTVRMHHWVSTYPLGWEEVLEDQDTDSADKGYSEVHRFLMDALSLGNDQTSRSKALLRPELAEMREILGRVSSRESQASLELSPGTAYASLWFNYDDKGSYAQSNPLYWDDLHLLWNDLKAGKGRFFVRSKS